MSTVAREEQVKAHTAYYAGDMATAVASYKQAYGFDPTPERAMDVGIALAHSGAFDESFKWFERAYAGRPDSHPIRVCYGEGLFREGRWLEAWEHWFPVVENSFKTDAVQWERGMDLAGKEVLVTPAGGFGDIFMLARYIPEVARRFGCKVSFAPTEDLVPVFLRQPSMAGVNMSQKRDWDVWMHLFHFPQLFQMTPETVCWNGPYIEPMDMPRSEQLRVGLKLGAGEKGDKYRFRSVPGEVGMPFIESIRETVDLVPLTLSDIDGDWVVNDWIDTIALISSCDLVIAADTSVLHMAGAMGKEAWAVLGDFNDAKWGKSSAKTPWYPTMTLFRGSGKGFKHTFEQVTAALSDWLLHQKEKQNAPSL